jgi:NADH-quinone oxidoreductase subunit E
MIFLRTLFFFPNSIPQLVLWQYLLIHLLFEYIPYKPLYLISKPYLVERGLLLSIKGPDENMSSMDTVDKIIDKYECETGVLIQLLLEIQKTLNWIPPEAIIRINKRLKIPVSEIYRVASFYTALSLKPRGRHVVRVCAGTACYVRGGPRILDSVERALTIRAGETTSDGKFTLETVNCLGCCALGPVVEIDGQYHGKQTSSNVVKLLSTYS